MPYTVRITREARKELAVLPRQVQARIVAAISGLSDQPRPPGSRSLVGYESYRIRVGNYRAIYTIDDDSRKVEVWRIRHRKDAYRGM